MTCVVCLIVLFYLTPLKAICLFLLVCLCVTWRLRGLYDICYESILSLTPVWLYGLFWYLSSPDACMAIRHLLFVPAWRLRGYIGTLWLSHLTPPSYISTLVCSHLTPVRLHGLFCLVSPDARKATWLSLFDFAWRRRGYMTHFDLSYLRPQRLYGIH